MEFTVTRSSDYDYEDHIEINSIEELLIFKDNYSYPIIIDTDENGDNTIEIYDDYRE